MRNTRRNIFPFIFSQKTGCRAAGLFFEDFGQEKVMNRILLENRVLCAYLVHPIPVG
jgi:hypothetical protein